MKRSWRRAEDKSANRFSLFTNDDAAHSVACTWGEHKRHRLHVVVVVIVADDHNMNCVHDVKHTYRFSTRFYGQILHALFCCTKCLTFFFALSLARLLPCRVEADEEFQKQPQIFVASTKLFPNISNCLNESSCNLAKCAGEWKKGFF